MKRILILFVAVLALMLGACGGGDDSTGDDARQSAAASAAGEGDDGGGGEDAVGSDVCSVGDCVDGLITELSIFPVPDFVDEFWPGSPDFLGSHSVQSMAFTVGPGEVNAFYETALPEAGFEVSPDQNPDHPEDFQYDLVAPDGREGSIWIRGAGTHPAQAKVSLEVSG